MIKTFKQFFDRLLIGKSTPDHLLMEINGDFAKRYEKTEYIKGLSVQYALASNRRKRIPLP